MDEQVGAGTAPTSLADRILGQDHVLRETVTIPEWEDVKLEARGLTVREVAKTSSTLDRMQKERRMELAAAVYIVAGIYDPDTGEKAFGEQHYDRLADEPSLVIERLAQAILRLSGMSTIGLPQTVTAYLDALDDPDATDETRELALVAVRKVILGGVTPAGEARSA